MSCNATWLTPHKKNHGVSMRSSSPGAPVSRDTSLRLTLAVPLRCDRPFVARASSPRRWRLRGSHRVELRLGGGAPEDRSRAPRTVAPRGTAADSRRPQVRIGSSTGSAGGHPRIAHGHLGLSPQGATRQTRDGRPLSRRAGALDALPAGCRAQRMQGSSGSWVTSGWIRSATCAR
jgi:hypothetical protein